MNCSNAERSIVTIVTFCETLTIKALICYLINAFVSTFATFCCVIMKQKTL